MKKLLTLLAVMIFSANITVAQNTGTVSQEGSDSYAELNQSSSSYAHIQQWQTGNHYANLDQTSSVASIRQAGSGNVVSSHPFNAPPSGAFMQEGSSLNVRQYGNNNTLVGSQSNSSGIVHQNEMFDHGDGNAAELIQSGGASATIEQEHYDDGSGYYEGNIARVTQEGASSAFVRQDGGANVADALQVGDGHDISLTQQGRNMDAAINQYGSYNTVEASQHNWNGTLGVNQGASDAASSDNGVYFRQTSGKNSFNSATIAQDGIGNMVGESGAKFVQTGNATLSVTQSGTSNVLTGQQFNGSATVTQTGASNDAHVIQQ